MPTKEQILEALKGVKFPGLSRDIVSFGFVHDVIVEGGNVAFTVRFQTENQNAKAQIGRDAEAAVRAVPGVENVRMQIDVGSRQAAGPQGGMPAEQILSGVKYKIAVASGKGRRRQVDGLDESGPGSARPRLHGGDARRRHLRPVATDDARHQRAPADRRERREDHSDGEPRHQDDVARPHHRSRHAGDLARADGDEGARSVPDRREVGRARLHDHRSAARHRRRPAHADAEGAAVRRGGGDDAAGRGADRCAQRAWPCSAK